MKRERSFKKSFYDMCTEMNKEEYLARWDYSLNIDSPQHVSCFSNKEFYFKCPRGIHESTHIPLSYFWRRNITSEFYPCKKCGSFAQFGIDTYGLDFLDKYWDYQLNTSNPWGISAHSAELVYIKCTETDYHDSYKTSCGNFNSGNRCPYCYKRMVHPYDSLATKYPHVKDIWSDLNERSPFAYSPSSGRKVWWKCSANVHPDYYRRIDHASSVCDFRCPQCVAEAKQSTYQAAVCAVLDKTGYTILHEQYCTLHPKWKKTTFYDNEVKELKLEIEVHGEHHYTGDTHYFVKRPEEEMKATFKGIVDRDKFKKEYAISHGYNYLEIPYTTIKDGTYVDLIKNTIASIESSLDQLA